MKKYLLIITTLFVTLFSFSQTNTEISKKKFHPNKATIKTMDGKKTKGWFYKMNDENIYLLPVAKNKKYFRTSDFMSPDINSGSIPIQVSQINSIALHKKNAGLKGALIGLGAGVITGAIIGFVEGDDPITPYTGDAWNDLFISLGNAFAMTAGEKAVMYGATAGLTGSLTGFIIGKFAKKKFIIGGQKNTYRDLQGDLMKRLIIK